MKRFIHVDKETRLRLQQEFNTTRTTVWRALTGDGRTESAKLIRKRALELGGIPMVLAGEMETLHDSDGYMRQYFSNGAMMEINKRTSRVEILVDGEMRACFNDVRMSELAAIQERAREY